MNSKTVLSKIMALLSKDEVALTFAKLADGTIVESPTFDVGETLDIVSEDGTKSKAPDGEHELSLKDTEGNETLIKVKTEAGVIVERENIELEDVKVEDIPAAGEADKVDEAATPKGSVESGTIKMEEETEEVETIPADDDKVDMGKMMQELAYRIEEMEKRMTKMEEVKEEVVDKEADIEEEDDIEEMELPKLDGAPVEEGIRFAAQTNSKNYGKKVGNSQSSFLSKLYK
jgi:predicted hydrocarbon binding protein